MATVGGDSMVGAMVDGDGWWWTSTLMPLFPVFFPALELAKIMEMAVFLLMRSFSETFSSSSSSSVLTSGLTLAGDSNFAPFFCGDFRRPFGVTTFADESSSLDDDDEMNVFSGADG